MIQASRLTCDGPPDSGPSEANLFPRRLVNYNVGLDRYRNGVSLDPDEDVDLMITRMAVCTGLGVLAGIGVMLAGPADAAETASQPASVATQPTGQLDPASVATQPAGQLDPAIESILDRLEAKGDTIKDIEANIHYVKIDPVLEDKQAYDGVLRFKKQKPNPVFFIRFHKRTQNGRIRREKEWHCFDGRWYWEARERTRQITKREIVAPGNKKEVFRLGEGPFPLPFGQKKADIVRHFTLKLIPAVPADPADCDHLELTPRPGTKLARDYQAIHFYVDRKLDLPIRVRTTEKEQGNELSVTFSQVKINPGLKPDKFKLPPEVLKSYAISEE